MLTLICTLDPDKTARHESKSRLRSSAFIKNEYFGKIRHEHRSERKAEEERRLFCLGHGKDGKDGKVRVTPRCFVWVRVRMRVSIHKQRDMDL